MYRILSDISGCTKTAARIPACFSSLKTNLIKSPR
jgi:hypothetical protein